MQKFFSTLVLVAAVASTALAQGSKSPETDAQLIKMEKDSWDAWKRQDAAWFEAHLAPDLPLAKGQTRAQVIKNNTTGCKVTSYSFEDFQVFMMSDDAALLTYNATQDAACDGKALPAKVRASSNFVRRDGKWFAYYHAEVPATK